MRFLRIGFIIFLACMIAAGIGLLYFIKKYQPPILQGNLEYSVAFKEDLTIDVYLPTREVYSSRPLIVFFHGGAWITGRKESINFARFNQAVNVLRDNGYAIVCPSYTLASEGNSPFPDCIEDAFDALEWVSKQAEKYNFDIQNVGVMGESAGAHLALMVAYASPADFGKEKPFRLNYAIDIYGPTDLYSLYQAQLPLLHKVDDHIEFLPDFIKNRLDFPEFLLGFDPESDTIKSKEFSLKYSPVHYLHAGIPNTMIIHGDKDRVVPVEQTFILRRKLEAMDINLEMHIVKGADHGFFGASEDQKNDVQNMIINFVRNNYSG